MDAEATGALCTVIIRMHLHTASDIFQAVRDKVYKPAGIKDVEPIFAPIMSEMPGPFPFFGCWWNGACDGESQSSFPDFSGGMKMSGRQYAQILENVMFEKVRVLRDHPSSTGMHHDTLLTCPPPTLSRTPWKEHANTDSQAVGQLDCQQAHGQREELEHRRWWHRHRVRYVAVHTRPLALMRCGGGVGR